MSQFPDARSMVSNLIITPEFTSSDLPEIAIQSSQESGEAVPVSPAHSGHGSHASPTQDSTHSMQSISTATYNRQEQEAQNAFNKRIEKLCQDIWPSPSAITHRFLISKAATRLRIHRLFRPFIPEPQLPLIQHLKGGGFNHITSIKLPPSYGGHGDLILRVPREDMSRPDQQVAILDYVRQRTSIPIPTIEATDFTCDNAVGKPYVIQHRIPGNDLASIWDDLSHSQRCAIAKEVGGVIKTLLSLESSLAGTIRAAIVDSSTSALSPQIVPFELTDARGDPVPALELANVDIRRSRETTLDFFEYNFARWRLASLAENLGEVDGAVELYDDMLRVVREMNNLGLFKPDLNCLCHLDLHPRNIMVDIGSRDSINVTGILDWDDAVVAPKFVNCQAPGWLWGYDKDEHTENSLLPWPYELEGANDPPSTLEQQELKDIFDDHAGPEYPRLAYDESSRLIRGLYRVATNGLTANWFYEAAERIVKEWDLLRPTFQTEV